LRAVEERSVATTDPVALNLFRQLRAMTADDQRFVLRALDDRVAGGDDSGARIRVARGALERFEAETGQRPSKKRYEHWRISRADSASAPSATFIANACGGSWANAMDRFGHRPAPDHSARRMAKLGATPSDAQLLQQLRACAAELGAAPRVHEHRRWRRSKLLQQGAGIIHGDRAYRARFGGWRQAVAAAGLPPQGLPPRALNCDWTNEEAIAYLRQAAPTAAKGRLRVSEYDAWRRHHLASRADEGNPTPLPVGRTIAERFGGWLAALAAADLLSQDAVRNLRVGHGSSFTDAELDQALARFARETSGSVSSGAYQSWRDAVMARDDGLHLPGRSVLARRLGHWAEAAARVREYRTTTPPRT